jgi:hypothetical protein
MNEGLPETEKCIRFGMEIREDHKLWAHTIDFWNCIPSTKIVYKNNDCSFNYHNSVHYPLSCSLYKRQRSGEPIQLGTIDRASLPLEIQTEYILQNIIF